MRWLVLFIGALLATIAGSQGIYGVDEVVLLATDYGTKCDGVTDDTSHIQGALNAAQRISAAYPNPQVIVQLPYGNCTVSTTSLAISSNNVSLKGAGMYSTQLQSPNLSSSNFDMLNLSGAGYASVSDLTIKSFYASNTNYGINNVSGAQMLISNVQIGGFQNGLGESGGNFTGSNLFIAIPSGGIGVLFSGSSQVRRLTNSIIFGVGAGTTACVKITGGAGYDLVTNELEHCNYALLVQPPASGNVVSIHSADNWYDTSTADGVLLDGSASSAYVSRVSFTGDWMSTSASGNGMELKGTAQGVQVSNTQIFNNAIDGIKVDDSTLATGFLAHGNLIAQNVTDGIYVGANVSNFTISGNTIGPAADFTANGTGLVIASGTGDNYAVIGNNLTGNTTAAFTNAASGTHGMIQQNADGEVVGASSFLGPSGQGNTVFALQGGIFSGTSNNVQALGGVAWGNNNYTSGAWSTAHGQEAGIVNRLSADCFTGTWFSPTLGSAQRCETVLNNSTFGTSAIRLTADGTGTAPGSSTSLNCVNIPVNSVALLTINIVGRDVSSGTGYTSWNNWSGIMGQGASASTFTVNMNTTPTPIQVGGFNPIASVTADTTNGCLNISVTPPSGNTHLLHFVADVQTVEVQ